MMFFFFFFNYFLYSCLGIKVFTFLNKQDLMPIMKGSAEAMREIAAAKIGLFNLHKID